jgi:hypothetical protein
MRRANHKDAFTPFGLWLQEYVNPNFSITNLDYVIEDYRGKRIQLIEEKQNGSSLGNAQALTFAVLDEHLHRHSQEHGYEYWGFFLLQFKEGCSFVGPGMRLNRKPITCEELQAHLNFEKRHCDPIPFKHRRNILLQDDPGDSA